jgi:hypothetical protein
LFISAKAKAKANVFFYARHGGYRPCGTLTAATEPRTPDGVQRVYLGVSQNQCGFDFDFKILTA